MRESDGGMVVAAGVSFSSFFVRYSHVKRLYIIFLLGEFSRAHTQQRTHAHTPADTDTEEEAQTHTASTYKYIYFMDFV